MSNEPAPITGPITPAALATAASLSTSMHRARLFPGIVSSETAMAVILAGAELGFGPLASLAGIHIIKGKITLSANLIAAAIQRSERYAYRVRELTDQACRIEFFARGESLGSSEFTMADARHAGLATGDNWQHYPRNMLFARAISNGAKWYCPELFAGGIYTPEELQVPPETGETEDAQWTPAERPPAPPGGTPVPGNPQQGSVADPAPVDTPAQADNPEATAALAHLEALMGEYDPEDVLRAMTDLNTLAPTTLLETEQLERALQERKAAALEVPTTGDADVDATHADLQRAPEMYAPVPATKKQRQTLTRLASAFGETVDRLDELNRVETAERIAGYLTRMETEAREREQAQVATPLATESEAAR